MSDPTPQTTPTRDEAVPERPRIEPLLKDGDVVDRLKQFRLRWQDSGDLTYLGKALVDAIVEIEAHRRASTPAPASGGVDAVARAIWNHLHYRHGGDYDGAEGSTARADTDCLARKIVAPPPSPRPRRPCLRLGASQQ